MEREIGTVQMGDFFGAPNDQKIDTVIEDVFLRKALIAASVKMEELVLNGLSITHRGVSKPGPGEPGSGITTPWGLEIDISMTRPKQDKPIIFRYKYSINCAALYRWKDTNACFFDGPAMVLFCRGIQFTIPGSAHKPEEMCASFVVRYNEDENTEIRHNVTIVNTPIEFIVHRDIVSEHDWIVKCIV